MPGPLRRFIRGDIIHQEKWFYDTAALTTPPYVLRFRQIPPLVGANADITGAIHGARFKQIATGAYAEPDQRPPRFPHTSHDIVGGLGGGRHRIAARAVEGSFYDDTITHTHTHTHAVFRSRLHCLCHCLSGGGPKRRVSDIAQFRA